ncbi:MAG: hypothetical protein ACJ0QO_02745 [Parvicellaceae bacterium]
MNENLPIDDNNKTEDQSSKPLLFDNLEKDNNPKSEVPTFLKVLCILSLINIVFGFFPALVGVFSDQTNAQVEFDQQISQMNDMFSSFEELPGNLAQEMTDFLNAKKVHLLLENSLLIMIFLLEAYGIWLMFKLKRKGFGLYVASQLGLIGLNFFIYPSSNIFTTATLFSLFFSSVLFVILYGVNIKHMNN